MGSFAAASTPVFAFFGIDNSGVGVAANLLVLCLVAVWLALAFWAWADARRRMTDSVLVGSAALAALIFPFVGALIYAIVRPPETLEDSYERDLDVRAAELRVRLLESAVKGGPGSGAHASALGAEVTGEPQQRPSAQAARPATGRTQPAAEESRRKAEPARPAAAQPRQSDPRRSGTRPRSGGEQR